MVVDGSPRVDDVAAIMRRPFRGRPWGRELVASQLYHADIDIDDVPRGLDAAADPRPGPDALVERDEADSLAEVARLLPGHDPYPELDAPREPPRPVHLLGTREVWHGVRVWRFIIESETVYYWQEDHRCQGCLNRRLRPNEYCLMCDRWGRDP